MEEENQQKTEETQDATEAPATEESTTEEAPATEEAAGETPELPAEPPQEKGGVSEGGEAATPAEDGNSGEQAAIEAQTEQENPTAESKESSEEASQ